jgi:hypothetical protein
MTFDVGGVLQAPNGKEANMAYIIWRTRNVKRIHIITLPHKEGQPTPPAPVDRKAQRQNKKRNR